MSRLLAVQRRWPTLTALIPLFILWEAVGQLRISFAFPPLSEIFVALGDVLQEPGFANSVLTSLGSLFTGFALAVLVGLVLGISMGLFRTVEAAFDFWVNVFMGAPIAAFVPLLVAIFGVGSGAIVSSVFVFSVFVIIVNAHTAVKSVPKNLLEMARSFGASPAMRLRRVVVPNALPLILTGVRVGFGRAVAGLVLGEMLVVIVGIGGMIMQRGSTFQVAHLWGLIFLACAVALTGTRLLEALQRRLTGWAVTQAAD